MRGPGAVIGFGAGLPFEHVDLEGDGKKEQFLLVTKLDGTGSCPMGEVDAALRNHNKAARDLADQNVDSFSCTNDVPIVVSQRYGGPGEFASGGSCSN